MKNKNSLLSIALVLSLLAGIQGAKAQEVGSWDELKSAIQNATTQIDILNNITNDSTSGLGVLGGSNNTVTINGNGYDINGNSNEGITVFSEQTLNVNNVGNGESAGFNGFSSSNGSAIYNMGTTNITGSTFSDNKSDLAGGAIQNSGTISIINSVLKDNSAIDNGGAIINRSNVIITDSVFSGNSSNNSGGAIWNSDTLTITDSVFTGNSANFGGAINNNGILNIIAKDSQTIFTGNTDNLSGSNAIRNNGGGTINLNAGGANIIFNDGISGEGSDKANININANYVKIGQDVDGNPIYAPTTGVVEFNNVVSGNTVNLYNGTVKLGSYTDEDNNTTSHGNFDNSVNFNVGSADSSEGSAPTLSLQDGGANTTNLGNLTLNSDLKLAIDADLAGETPTSDMITANSLSNDSGKNIIISSVNILTDADNDIVTTNVADGVLKNVVTLAQDAEINKSSGVEKNYLLAYDNSGNTGILTYDSTIDLATAVQNTDTERVYNMNEAENVTTSLGSMGGTNSTLTINGNGHDINGNTNLGITVNDGQTLNVNNVGEEETLGFNGFSSGDGGAIYNKGTTNITDSTFSNNTAKSNGGAIYNEMDSTTTITNSTYSNNTARGGGAIYNWGTTTITDSDFNNNKTDGLNGGAIYNMGTTTITNSDFNNNTAASNSGAIYNGGKTTIVGSDFSNNTANTDGGAILNEDTATIIDSTFSNNTAASNGGAINNWGRANIIASTKDTVFTGNTAGGKSNALYQYRGTTNLNASDNASIIFNDGIDGDANFISNNIININNTGVKMADGTTDAPTTGVVEFNNEVKNSTVNMYNGVLKFGTNTQDNINYTGTFADSVNFNYNGGTVSIQNNGINSANLGNLTLNKDMDLRLDANFAELKMDTITATSFNDNGNNINISNIFITEPTTAKSFSISPIGDGMSENLKATLAGAIKYTGGDITYSPIYKYNATYDPTTAMFNFGLVGGGSGGNTPGYNSFNPSVMAAPVAAQLGGYLNQLNAYDNAFRNMDMYMLMTKEQRQAMKLRNKYASVANNNIIFDPTVSQYENKAGWFRPYATFENVSLNNGPKVSNVAYGSYFGADSGLYDLGHGWDGMLGVYIGYNGSHQAYDGVSIYQNGGTLGAVGVAYKGNFFTGLTLNVGANAGEANTMFGHEDFAMLMTGVASKTGYNIELAKGKFIIQPSFLMSYSFINTFDYTNAAGVSINSDPLHAIQLEPGVKFIFNLKNGWQPYLGVSMVWNIMDRTQFTANTVSLPDLSVDPFVKYGVGVRKSWGERFTGFFQTYITNGGRNGVGLQAGFRWALGKTQPSEKKASGNIPELPKTQVTLNNIK